MFLYVYFLIFLICSSLSFEIFKYFRIISSEAPSSIIPKTIPNISEHLAIPWIRCDTPNGQLKLTAASLRGKLHLDGNTRFPLFPVTGITFHLCCLLCRIMHIFRLSKKYPVLKSGVLSVIASCFTGRTQFMFFTII